MRFISTIQVIIGRAFLLGHSFAVVGLTAVILKDNLYVMFGAVCLFQIIEAIYMVVKRHGYEYKWLSLSTVFYLITVVPPLWFVEINQLNNFKQNATTSNIVTLGVSFDQNLGIEVIKQTLLLVIMIHRWIIPRGALTRNSLSQLLFVFFAIASDIMELFELFEEDRVMRDGTVGYAILGVWTLSLTQMCTVLTNTRSAVRARVVQMEDDETFERMVGDDPPGPNCCYTAMATDLWSVMLTLFTMDLPFLVVRLYIIVKLKVFTYGIIFFTVKNMLVICLSIYRFVIICGGRIDDDDEECKQKPPEHMSVRRQPIESNKVVPVT